MLAWAFFYIGKYKIPKFCDLIVHIFIAKLCIYYYLIVPFGATLPKKFELRSIIVCIRCSMVVAIFGVNGIIDVIAGLVMPLIFVMLASRRVDLSNASKGIFIPITLVTILGCTIFNFIILEE